MDELGEEVTAEGARLLARPALDLRHQSAEEPQRRGHQQHVDQRRAHQLLEQQQVGDELDEGGQGIGQELRGGHGAIPCRQAGLVER